MKNYINIILMSMLINFTGCKENPTEQPIELNPLLTEEMVNNVSLDPGIRIDSLNLKGGIVWNYSISVPEINSNEKVPLVLGLHWAAGGGEYENYLRCLAEPGFKKINAIIFTPDAGKFYFWDENNYSLILTLIEYAKKYWPIDENKIIVSGYSMGGIGTWFFGTNYPQIFSAAIPVGSWIEHNKKLKIPFYVIHGENDELCPIEDIKERVSNLKELGSDIQLHVIDGFSHYTHCSYSYQLTFASDWLLNEVWE